jgi:hypothetical protein
LQDRQFLKRPLASLLQLHSLCRRDGTSFKRKLDPQLKSTLQLRQRRREAGVNPAPEPLATDFTRARLETLLKFLVTSGDPTDKSTHRGYQMSLLAGALTLAERG